MPRGVKKEHLPSKICVICNRPFTWRKKWERCWDEVTTCSKSCNNQRRQRLRQQQQQGKNQSDGGNNESPIQQQQHQQRRSMSSATATIMDDDSRSSQEQQQQHEDQHSIDNLQEEIGENVQQQDQEQILVELLASSSFQVDDEGDVHATFDNDDNDMTSSKEDDIDLDPIQRKKAERKAAKKRKKAERRAQREGRGDPSAGQKCCDMCGASVNLLIRCMYEEGQTDWKMVCGKCWKVASGGGVDGDTNHPHYRYGGLWKNRRKQG